MPACWSLLNSVGFKVRTGQSIILGEKSEEEQVSIIFDKIE